MCWLPGILEADVSELLLQFCSFSGRMVQLSVEFPLLSFILSTIWMIKNSFLVTLLLRTRMRAAWEYMG